MNTPSLVAAQSDPDDLSQALRGGPQHTEPQAVTLHPYCNVCGWRKGGIDSWDGKACKCGHFAEPLRCKNCGKTIAEHDRLLHCHSGFQGNAGAWE